jgi:hypothetical protein
LASSTRRRSTVRSRRCGLRDGVVTVQYKGAGKWDWRERRADMSLNATIPWDVEIVGGDQQAAGQVPRIDLRSFELTVASTSSVSPSASRRATSADPPDWGRNNIRIETTDGRPGRDEAQGRGRAASSSTSRSSGEPGAHAGIIRRFGRQQSATSSSSSGGSQKIVVVELAETARLGRTLALVAAVKGDHLAGDVGVGRRTKPDGHAGPRPSGVAAPKRESASRPPRHDRAGIVGLPSFSVRIRTGRSALTRIPSGPLSFASDRVNPTIPALPRHSATERARRRRVPNAPRC